MRTWNHNTDISLSIIVISSGTILSSTFEKHGISEPRRLYVKLF